MKQWLKQSFKYFVNHINRPRLCFWSFWNQLKEQFLNQILNESLKQLRTQLLNEQVAKPVAKPVAKRVIKQLLNEVLIYRLNQLLDGLPISSGIGC